MTDIVERLRMGCGHGKEALDYASMRMEEAADEIERLRAKNHELASTIATRLLEKKPCDEIERLRAALTEEIAVARETDDALAKADVEIERLRAELHSAHAHMNHLRTGLSVLRHVADVARDLVEECRPGIAPSLGTLAKLEDALHTEWKT
jgi:chromosome segregation ATPase